MKTLIVDDHALIRVFLKHYLEEHFPCFNVEVLRHISASLPENIINAKPKLVILDISLDQLDSLDFFSSLKQQLPETHFIIYTMHNITSYKNFFWREGADAYVLKEDAQSELSDVIRNVLNGNKVYPQLFTEPDIDYHLNQLSFTPIEKELLSALIESKETNVIAKSLNLSTKEILKLRHLLLEKTGAKNTQELIKFTIDYNWIR